MLRSSLPKLLVHDFLAKKQSCFLNDRKKSLKNGEVLATGDFSENYSFIVQNSVQDYYWTNHQATLHPWVCYYVDDNGQLQHISIIMISDHMKHDSTTVYTFQNYLLRILKEKIPFLQKVIYMSDGAGSQYKNKHNFENLCLHEKDFGVPAEWHFFATSHGKGACDGIGGTFKRAAAKASLQRPLTNQIVSVKELVEWAESWDSKIEIVYVPTEEVAKKENFLAERKTEEVKTIEGTRSFHSFEPVNEDTIRVRAFSTSQDFKDIKIYRKKSKK